MSRRLTLLVAFFLLLSDVVYGESAVYKLHTDSTCSSIPTIIGFQESPPPSCSAIATCTSVNIANEDLYWDRICTSKVYDALSESVYESKPYVLMEIYDSGTKCTKLLSGVAFLADGSCLVTDNGVSSMKVSLHTDGSATFMTYRGTNCNDAVAKTTKVTQASIASHSCEHGALKFYASDAATTATTPTRDGSDRYITTTTSQSAPHAFTSSMFLIAVVTMTAVEMVVALH